MRELIIPVTETLFILSPLALIIQRSLIRPFDSFSQVQGVLIFLIVGVSLRLAELALGQLILAHRCGVVVLQLLEFGGLVFHHQRVQVGQLREIRNLLLLRCNRGLGLF